MFKEIAVLQKKLEDEEARNRVAALHHDTYTQELRATIDAERRNSLSTREQLVRFVVVHILLTE